MEAQQQQDEQQQQNQQDQFQECIANLLMEAEELRQQFRPQPQPQKTVLLSATRIILQWRHSLEGILHSLHQLQPTNELEMDLRNNCEQRAAQITFQALQTATKTKPELDPLDADPELERECQGAIARMAEMNLMLLNSACCVQSSSPDQQLLKQQQQYEIVDLYVQYQRDVIRQRSKPAIARLVAYRNNNKEEHFQHQHDDDDDDDDEERQKSQHSHVITTILGQASSLIHPLLVWKSQLPPEFTHLHDMCSKSIAVLDEQAQTMTQRVMTWCCEDLKVDEWIGKSAANDDESSSMSSLYQNNNNALGKLDAVVEEVAFICQVVDRYVALTKDHNNTTTNNTILQQLHPEWTWKYASLERYLTTQQWRSALALANPVEIVMGTPIKVPSVVEDAQYLSTRGLQRAASTRSAQAIGTVAHSIASDVWSTTTDLTAGGVHQALMDQKGCWKDETVVEENNDKRKKDASAGSSSPTKPSSSTFAAALMGALDDDLTTNGTSSSSSPVRKSNNRPPSAPSSSGILGSLSSLGGGGGGGGDKLLRIRLDTHLCALNGIYSASAACTSLVKFLDSLHDDQNGHDLGDDSQSQQQTPKTDAMTQLAREELFRYANEYTNLLQVQVHRVVAEFCGTPADPSVYKGPCCLPIFKYYLEREEYQLSNAVELRAAEDDARLHQQWIQPLQESKLLSQLNKCEPNVLQVIHETLSEMLVETILNCLLVGGVQHQHQQQQHNNNNNHKKRFTDWGSLLLSKQVRLIQEHLSQVFVLSLSTSSDLLPSTTPAAWEKLSQVVTVLQLEKPSDWAFYQPTSILSVDELEQILNLRVDFSSDVIASVVTGFRKQASGSLGGGEE